ncbi:DUF871 domain-containing protein [Enterococcus sp. LJL128]
MYGISIFLGEGLTEQKIKYIQELREIGFRGIFTSLHIPEDDASLYLERLKALGRVAASEGMKLMVDISGATLERAGLSTNRVNEILALGVTGLRMDYAISNKEIAELSHQLTVGLNASTITAEDIAELKKYEADFSSFEAWHNYYPRPETGLDKTMFVEKNRWLSENGFEIFAFVPGNRELRGPLFEGLPTLEEHRGLNPLAAALQLKELAVDAVYIGDPEIDFRTIRQFEGYLSQKQLILETEDVGSRFYEYVLGEHTNRLDAARDVIRSAAARFRQIPVIEPEIIRERTLGLVTVDNKKYGRYMGEIQIIRKYLPKDEKVNIAAEIAALDKSLVSQIKGGVKFKLVKKGFLTNELR